MATKAQTPLGELTGNVPLYGRPEPLNPQTQAKLGLSTIDKPFMFSKAAHAVPLSVTEFGPASLRFPIIFTGEDKQPVAVLSIRQNENLFLKEDGFYEMDVYVPAYIRRYPFVLASETGSDRLIVCIDRDAEAVQENGEIPLFENDQPTKFTQNAIEFCTNFENERLRTVAFVKELEKLGLFEMKTSSFTPQDKDGVQGQPVNVAEYWGISETKLAELSGETLIMLRDSGALQQIYIQISSMQNWERLITRTLMKDDRPFVAANA